MRAREALERARATIECRYRFERCGHDCHAAAICESDDEGYSWNEFGCLHRNAAGFLLDGLSVSAVTRAERELEDAR